MLVLGNYDKTQNYIVNGGKEFCDFDDYNWDWTLQHLSMKCIPDKIRLLKMKATRIFHLGECGGMHTKNKNCDLAAKAKQVGETLSKNQQYLFPNTIVINGESRLKLRDPKPNGGWGDLRDRTMCKSFFNASIAPFLR
nr:hypothetical protein BaRGS_031184 [Batillaria attramentaria]